MSRNVSEDLIIEFLPSNLFWQVSCARSKTKARTEISSWSMGLCETFLNQNTDNYILNMQGYHIERKDRDQCHLITPDNGGGRLVYIANHLNYTRRNYLEFQNVESI